MSMIRPGGMPPFPKEPKEEPKRFPNGFPVGKRTKRRQAVIQKLNRTLHIRECELKLKGCWRIVQLTWAHAKKSRFIQTDAEWKRAARACLHCHEIIEAMPHDKMEAIVQAAIDRRGKAGTIK